MSEDDVPTEFMSTGGRPVVVGVDGSDNAVAAVAWAAEEAAGLHRPLRVVHGFIWPMMRPRVPLGPPPGGPAGSGLRAAAEKVLRDAEGHALAAFPDLEVTTELVVGPATVAVLEQSRDAEMVVLGSRGIGGFLGLLIGSTGVHVAAHAPCPVVVVRPRPGGGPPAGTGRVVVGVDGSGSSRLALDLAVREAARRGVGVLAVRAWQEPVTTYPELVSLPEDREDEEGRLLTAEVEQARRDAPDVVVETELVESHPVEALLQRSVGASLVVVGSRGRGGFAGLLLGSVSQALVQHADCPVAVVRHHSDEPGPVAPPSTTDATR